MTLIPTATTPSSTMILDEEEEEEKPLQQQLSHPIVMAERIRKLSGESVSFKFFCLEVAKYVDTLSLMLRSLVRFTTAAANSSSYDRPIYRVSAEVSRTLNRAHTLVRKCRRRHFLYRLINLVSAADFRKLISSLEASVADLRWLLSIFRVDAIDDQNDLVRSLPPIASNDPILAWVWSFSATVQLGSSLSARIEAAQEISSLARDNDRNKKIIVEEGGIPPLLKLLKEENSVEAQIEAATALYHVANDGDRVRVIVDKLGIPLIVQVLADSSMKVQIKVSDLVAKMAEFDGGIAKEEFGMENVIRPLVSLLSFETFEEELELMFKFGKNCGNQSIHSVVQINKEKEDKEKRKESNLKPKLYSTSMSSSSLYFDVGSSRGQTRKGRENENPEVKRELKINCAKALWMLAKNCLSNCVRITETKGLLCLAKLIEKEKGELQEYCLMAIMEITSAAESNADLRRSVFKTNSPPARAVVDQLLRVIKESGDPSLQIPAIRSIGCLSRTFPARETRVIGPLVEQLGNEEHEVANQAAIALAKFANPENFLCLEHSKAIIEFNGVRLLFGLLRASDRVRLHGLILLCYLAIHASDNEAFNQAMVLTALEGVDQSLIAHNPQLAELIVKARNNVRLYRGDIHPLRGNLHCVYK